MHQLAIHLFGLPQFFLDGTQLKVERRKTLALLAYLACAPAAGCSREELSALLWPDAAQEQAAAYLRQALWDFSKAAGEAWIERDGPAIRLRYDETVQVDVRVFEKQLAGWKKAQQERVHAQDDPEYLPWLEQAAGLYQDDFLAGFTLRDSSAFDEWQTLQVEGLRLKLGEALEALTHLHKLRGADDLAISCGRRWLTLDPLNETAHRELMRLYDAAGQRSAALRQFETCQRQLQEELGVAPEPATLQLFQQINARRSDSGPPRTAGSAPRPPTPVFLPTQTTPFLGREEELALIRDRLANPECRLITLVGPGGSGKTRLAIQAAGQSIGYPHPLDFPHGVYFAGLANASSTVEVIQIIAAALKLELRSDLRQGLSAGTAREQLLAYLAEKKLLLALDNFEQVAEFSFISDLLACAPATKLLVTSRLRLNLPEEWVLEVNGLPFPGQAGLAEIGPVRAVQSYPAVQLFCRCAARAGNLTPAGDDWPAIIHICQMVEGLPLGVELAAAWVKLLSCQEIAEEISRSLDFLESAYPGAPERQRSLRGVFEHSWRLLTENERVVFCRLSIFRGGFTREAAFRVTGASLKLLNTFINKTMLRRISSGRYDLHGIVKQYAAEKLAADPAALAETEACHAHYYADWLSQKSDALRGRDFLAALATLRVEIHNIRRGWVWLADHREYERLQPILPNLILFHEMQGENAPGSQMMQILIEAIRNHEPASQPKTALVRGLLGLALAANRHFRRSNTTIEPNGPLQTESLALAQSLPPNHMRAFILLMNSTGPNVFSPDQGIGMCQESAAIFQSAGDPWGSGLSYLIMGDTWMFAKQDPGQARAAYETSLAIFEQLGNDWGRALCTFGLASFAWLSGQLEEAARLIQQSMHIYEQMGNMGRVLDTRNFAGRLAAAAGQSDLARQYFAANQAYLIEVGDHEQSRYYAKQIAGL